MARMKRGLVLTVQRKCFAAILLMGVIAPAICADWPQRQLTITSDNGSPYVAVGGTLNLSCVLPDASWWDPCMSSNTRAGIDATWSGYFGQPVDNNHATGDTLQKAFMAPSTPGTYTVTIVTTLDPGSRSLDGDDDFPDGQGSFVITVVGLDKIQVQEGGGGTWADAPTGATQLCILSGTTANFKAVAAPDGASWPPGKPVWGGAASGSGATSSVTFNSVTDTTTTAECGNTVTVNVRVYQIIGNTTPDNNFDTEVQHDMVLKKPFH